MPPKLDLTALQARAILASRAKVPTALELFRPAEHQEEFFRTMAKDNVLEIMLGGGVRAGKSLAASAAMTSMITNKPIIFRDGTELHMRPARWRNEALKIWILGADWDHCGRCIFRLLFQPDSFRIVRDQKTGKWRTWNPASPDELSYEHTRPSPAFITAEDIKGGEDGMSWENKKENQLNSCTMHDGTLIQMFPSTAKAPPKGDPVHMTWIDEHIHSESWYSELMSRLIDYRGRLLWTAWADTAPSASITEARERAEVQNGKPDQRTYAFTLKGGDNPYTDSEHRNAIMDTMDEEVRAARDEGIANSDRWRIYSRFSKFVHRVMNEFPQDDDPLAAAIRKANGIPADWTRYLVLDPGTQRAAVLFVAVPPPSLWSKFGDYIVPYDEFYVPRTSARPLAQAIAAKCKGVTIEDIIADSHACRQTPMGFSGTIGQNYEKEFALAGVTSRRHGSRLTYGSDNVAARILDVQGTFNIRGDGSTQLRVVGCHQLLKQMEKYKWGMGVDGNPTNEPAKYQKVDLVQCLEYFTSRKDCGYFKPPDVTPENQYSKEAVMKSLKTVLGITNTKKNPDRSVYLGAGPMTPY